ncbi:HNH endonuclease [Ralstonia solanacearum]|nr:HNH endonuclease [Ralstonia solanacearum]NKF72411.1 HNH endonuclease [Ralstonia solanacearum]
MKARPFSKEELDYMRQHYADTNTKDMARKLGRNPRTVYKKAWLLGLEKSAKYLKENCRLKPGHTSHRHKPVGSERISCGYLQRKLYDTGYAPADWVNVHRIVWEEANGPIPSGHVVCFLPDRKTTVLSLITADALELVSRVELARRNHPLSKSPEFNQLVQLKSAITRQVNRIAREAKERQS